MKPINPASISPQQMQIFIAAAESENFSQAAKTVNVTQPLVSQTISTLEAQLGFKLFSRDCKKISLKPEGRVLLVEWKKIYSLMTKSIEKACDISQGASSVLHLISHTQLCKADFVFPLIDSFKKSHPDVRLDIEGTELMYPISSVQAHSSDIGFTILCTTVGFDSEKFRWERLFHEPRYVEVPVTLPISEKMYLTIQDLKGVPIALLDSSVNSSYMIYNNDILQVFKNNGITPWIHSYSRNLDTLMLKSAFGDAAVILPSTLESHHALNAKRIPLLNCGEVGPIMFWNAQTENKCVAQFVSYAMAFIEDYRARRAPGLDISLCG